MKDEPISISRSPILHRPPPTTQALRFLRLAFLVLPFIFLTLFFCYPLAAILRLGLTATGLGALLGDRYYVGVLGFSLWLGLVSTILTLAVGLPAAAVIARYRFRGRTLLRAIATAPFVLPIVVVVAGYNALLGPSGLLGDLARAAGFDPPLLIGTIGLVLLAHVFYNTGVVVRLVGGLWQTIDPRLEQAAALLGASRARIFRKITLPLLTPAIGAAGLLVFLFTFGSFGVVLLLGGPRMATLEVEIYRQTAQQLRLEIAAGLALLQAVVTLLVGWQYGRMLARGAARTDLRARAETLRPARDWRARLMIGVVAIMLLLLALPLPALAIRSLTLPGAPGLAPAFTLDYYQLLGENRRGSILYVPPLQAVRNSLGFATAATALALFVGVPTAYLLASARGRQSTGLTHMRNQPFSQPAGRLSQTIRRRALAGLDLLVTLPIGVSAVMLGLGYIVGLGPLGVLSSPLLIPTAHALLAFPIVVRALVPALRGLSPRMREAARALGAGPARVLLAVELPLLTPALAAAAVFAFTVSLGDFGAALLLARPDFPTVPTAIARLLGQPGASNYGQALALGTLMMLISTAGFLVIERIRPEGVGEI